MKNKTESLQQKETNPQKLVPKLRFPEFRQAGAWVEKPLGKFIEEFRENSTIQDEFEVLTSARNGLVRQKDYYDNDRIVGRDNIGFNIIPPKYLTYRSRSDDRQFFFNENNLGITGIVSIYYPVFRIVDGCNKFFVELSSLHSNTIGKYSVGSSQTVLSLKELKRIKLPLPTSEEQQKIAACLSSIDELIAAYSQKLEILKTHKKWLMKHLFPTEGKAVPKMRFSEFRDAPEWEETLLGAKATKIGSGITPNGGEKNYKSNGRPFIRSQNIGWGCLILEDVAYIDDATHSTFSATEIKDRDVFLNITGASIGRSAVSDLRVLNGNVNQHVCIIRTRKSELNPYFLNQYLLSQYGQKQIDSFQAGGNRQGLNFAQIKSFSLPLPAIEEQQKVANCLTSMDVIIAAQSKKLDTLKAHKSGLAQQLIPSVDEVS